jgi:hypothetical protein
VKTKLKKLGRKISDFDMMEASEGFLKESLKKRWFWKEQFRGVLYWMLLNIRLIF